MQRDISNIVDKNNNSCKAGGGREREGETTVTESKMSQKHIGDLFAIGNERKNISMKLQLPSQRLEH